MICVSNTKLILKNFNNVTAHVVDLTDKEQIGATYGELEWAMNYYFTNNIFNKKEIVPANSSQR